MDGHLGQMVSASSIQASAAPIHLLGSGIYSFFDLTLYTQELLSQCSVVYTLHDLPSLERFVARVAVESVNLTPMYYREGRDRREIYRDIADHVIQAAGDKAPVALLMHGHPLVYSSVSRLILEKARLAGLAVNIVPGVSALDRIFVDLQIDIAERGIQILDAAEASERNIAINPVVDSLFLQVGAIGELIASRLQSPAVENLLPFKRYLLEFFPKEHIVTIVESAVEIGCESRLTESSIGELEDAFQACNYNASLYIPAVDP